MFSLKELHEIFGKYGKIESMKILKNKIDGYVTFESDWDAYRAFKTEKGISVKVAYSWKQPKSKAYINDAKANTVESNDETTSPFLNLNDDCICEVFDLCDNASLVNFSESCNRLKRLLQNRHKFTRIDKEFSVKATNGKCSMTPLEAHKMLRLMGQYFETLIYSFGLKNSVCIEIYKGMIQCFMQQAAKYCPNIRRMILNIVEFEESLIEPLFSTVFPNLHTLDVCVGCGGVLDADTILMQCPNLKKLTVWGYTRIILSKASPSLEKVNIYDSQKEKYDKFFEQNPQLKRLKFVFLASVDNFDDFSMRLPNIEKLTIGLEYADFAPVESLINLANFKKLTKLTFGDCFGENLANIAPFVPVLENIKQLKIGFARYDHGPIPADDDTQEQIDTIIRKFPNLECFKLEALELKPEHVSYLKQSLGHLKSLQLHRCPMA